MLTHRPPSFFCGKYLIYDYLNLWNCWTYPLCPVGSIVKMLYFKLSSMLMFDVYNNTAPHNISHLFIPTQQIHSYSTRSSSSGNYYISHSRLNQKNDSFSIMGAKIWNSIPENLRNSSKSLFKEKVHTILLKIFEVQDRYADLNTIISDFKKY